MFLNFFSCIKNIIKYIVFFFYVTNKYNFILYFYKYLLQLSNKYDTDPYNKKIISSHSTVESNQKDHDNEII